MMGIDAARVSDPVIGVKREREDEKDNASVTGGDNPLFSAEEQKLNIEIPEGWKTIS